ncbi:hypothetical protein RND81_01G108400 [Saponaria officinalis]|uniref:PhoD-like phosphatase metallophosphatase domain-containing protein n=1 Tax=Saponaria officinalis TaxID=3572 RepID=A0AAW1N6Q5_SAPOF
MLTLQSSHTNAAEKNHRRTAAFKAILSILLINSARCITSSAATSTTSGGAPVSRIAFGSCSNQSDPQMIWNAIVDYNSQVFIWLGDNIYGDHKRPFKVFGKERTIGPWKNVPRFYPSSEYEMESSYKKAKSNPGYSYIRKHSKVIGTWDDHDYGLNDAGKEFAEKVTNQRLLLDFLDEPTDSPRRNQAGVYTSYTFGPVDKQIKVILLDTRYFRDPISSDGSILGSSQWEWLERQLYGPPAVLTVIASSIQRDGVLFISGDVHFAEITRYDCATGYPLYDVTSSGLTQSVEGVVPPALEYLLRFMAWLTPATLRVMENCRYKSCVYGKPNFGIIEVDWESQPLTLKIEVRDVNGVPVASNKFLISDLHANNRRTSDRQKYCTLEVDLPWITRYRLAIIVFSGLSVLLFTCFGLAYLIIFASKRCLRKCKHD